MTDLHKPASLSGRLKVVKSVILVIVRPETAGGGREGGSGEVRQVLGTLAEDRGEGEDGEEEGDDHLRTSHLHQSEER